MPKIYDNKETSFLSGLSSALDRSYKSDICTAYFNLRGWKKIAKFIANYKGKEDDQCRLLLGMYAPDWQLKKELLQDETGVWTVDNNKARKLRAETLKKFRNQLMMGVPSNEDEQGLRKLAIQLKTKKVIVKCFTRHPLHAKLYLTFNNKEFAGKIGFLGSSNLTYAGLEKNGELNIDVLDQQVLGSLKQWFEDKWQDQFSLDISEQIIGLIEESWAGEKLLPPYHVYMKMAYHLSEDARKGLTDFFIPKDLKNTLFDFQSSAVRIAARYVYYRKGVLIGDVVGLGKTLMAIATAKILEEEKGFQSLILCPKNLQDMWEDQKQKYGLRGTVIPLSQVQKKLPPLRRHHIVIIDESHNLRNPLGKRYKVVKDYIVQNDSRCILLSATPYNKTYKDLSNQLGLFIDPDENLGVRPSKFLKEAKEKGTKIFNGPTDTLKTFEESGYSEDWQNLMSEFLIRRTRSFIKENYGKKNQDGRYYIETTKGGPKFFPNRIAKTIQYQMDEQYRRFFSKEVVDMINSLKLARYDLIKYKKKTLQSPTTEEQDIFRNLGRSKGYPKGFCRINLFKTLESSGFSFLQSVQRHILRNCIFIYAINTKQDLIIGEKGAELFSDASDDKEAGITGLQEDSEEISWFLTSFNSFYKKAEKIYNQYRKNNSRSMQWISSSYFTEKLKEDLKKDVELFLSLLKQSQNWNPEKDLKLKKLENLLQTRKEKKVLIFTQLRETANYLKNQLKERGVKNLHLITGGMDSIQSIVKRFSPRSNEFNITSTKEPEIDILITTDVLSEGQNLQDCNTVINYDLPWAVIKLVQRVGRVDRIGQLADKIFCQSFMPDKGLEELINLRGRIQQRLKENAEVIGTDEQFFENERQVLMDLYHEQSKALEREIMDDIDLSSFAYAIWEKGIKQDPSLEKIIKNLPNVVHASKAIKEKNQKEGVLLFAKSHVHNWLMYLNEKGQSILEDQMKILKLAECTPDTQPLKRTETHYEIINSGLKIIQESLNQPSSSNRLGTSRHPRRKLFEKMEKISEPDEETTQIIDDLHHYPLSNEAEHTLNRMFRRQIPDKEVFNLVREKYRNETLLNKKETKRMDEKPRIISSMGLYRQN